MSDYDIAIVGMACRFPGAQGIGEYWNNLKMGVESISHFSIEELIESGVPAHLARNSHYVRAAPVLTDTGRFDAALFGYSPRDAVYIDPQQRHILELAWGALDNAGYDPQRYDGRIATYAGVALNSYMLSTGLAKEITNDYLPVLLGSDKDFLATRVAYKLGLTGPAITVQTACSTSLVALHLACQGLLNQESDMALVGAAAIRVPLKAGHLYEEGSVFTPDAHCKPFAAAANGTIFGSGAGVVLIKRLNDAIEDKDNIWAVIKGTAINNDGSNKADYTAPSVNMQAEVITEALASGDVNADTISYVEAHGTGTYHGDPIEIEALTRAYRADTDKKQYCGIGSVKSNIGHLDAAAGLASLIKVALALKYEELPPTLNFDNPNPQIDFENTPFEVISKNRQWVKNDDSPRRAAITSLGMGGTNAHAVLEEAPEVEASSSTADNELPQLLVFSANTETALEKSMQAMSAHIRENPSIALADIALTLGQGRQILPKRKTLAAYSASEVADIIDTADKNRIVSARGKAIPRDVVMMFPGQGAQFARMGHGLYQNEPEFKTAIDECAAIFSEELKQDFLAALYPDDTASLSLANEELARTSLTQPALFATEYAYAKLALSKGIIPTALIGHSIGEYVAATISGVFDTQSAARLVAARGQLMQAAPEGSMLAVALPWQKLTERVGDELDLAVINNPEMTVIAGPTNAIIHLQDQLSSEQVNSTILRTSHAFHSRMMDGASAEFSKLADKISFSEPTIPFISNVTGNFITTEQACNPSYWASHIRQTVLFSDGLATLFEQSPAAFLETGPGTSLMSLVQQYPGRDNRHIAISTSRNIKSDIPDDIAFLNAVGGLWANGATVSLDMCRRADARRVPLPSYCFEGVNHWFEAKVSDVEEQSQSSNRARSLSDQVHREEELTDWLWAETFQLQPYFPGLLGKSRILKSRCLLVGARGEDTSRLIAVMKASGVEVVDETIGASDQARPLTREDYQKIIKSFDDKNHEVALVIYLPAANANLERADDSLIDLIHLAQALNYWDGLRPCHLSIVTQGAINPTDERESDPHSLMLTATAATIARESDHISTLFMDCESLSDLCIDKLLGAIVGGSVYSNVTCIRNDGKVWTRKLTPVKVPEVAWPKESGQKFLFFGGFGDAGRHICTSISVQPAQIGLVSREPLPARELWESSDLNSATMERIRFVRSLEARGSKVVTLCANLLNANQVEKAVSDFTLKFGNPDLVFHLGGIVDDAPVLAKADESIKKVLAPKLIGTRNIARALESLPETKLVLFSSISAFQATPGKIDYATANAYQSAFAKSRSNTFSIAWPAFRGSSMMKNVKNAVLREQASNTAIDYSDAPACIGRALDSGLSSLIVTPVDLERLASDESVVVEPNLVRNNLQEKNSAQTLISTSGKRSIQEVVTHQFGEILGFDPSELSEEDNFFDLGGSSLVAVKLVARLEREFTVPLPVQLLVTSPTIRMITKEIQSRRDRAGIVDQEPTIESKTANPELESSNEVARQTACLIPLFQGAPVSDRPNFFLMHGHGGTLMLYRRLAREMSADWLVWGLQSLGLDSPAEPLHTFEEMATQYIAEMRTIQTSGPYYIGGNCGGGTLAWEVARQLEEQGLEVGLVMMLDSPHKDYPNYPATTNPVLKTIGPYIDRYKAIGLLDTQGVPKWLYMGKRILNSAIGQVRRLGIKDMERYSDEIRAAGNKKLLEIQHWNRRAFYGYNPSPIQSRVVFYSAFHQPIGATQDHTLGYQNVLPAWWRNVVLPGSYHNDFNYLDLSLVQQDLLSIREERAAPGIHVVDQDPDQSSLLALRSRQ